MITLAAAGVTLELDEDLQWVDEHNWSSVVRSMAHSISGALIIDTGIKLAGRPITLQPPDDSAAWMPLAVVSQLKAWEAVPELVMLLSIRGQSFEVMFRGDDEPAVEATPRTFVSNPQPGSFGDDYLVTLRLIEV